MIRHSLVIIAAMAIGTIGLRAQCPPASSERGFHQERLGSALASQGDEALFGHLNGWNAGLHERRGNDTWPQVAHMGGSGSHPARMGSAVALRGNIAVLGDQSDYSLPGSWSLAPNGAAVVYERAAGVWSRISELYPVPPTNATSFGMSVAIADDGSRVIVGAPSLAPSGAVHIYIRQPSGWTLEQTILGATLSPPAAIGRQFAMSNGRLFVAVSAGALPSVLVLERQGGVWSVTGALAPSGLAPSAGFGSVIVVDGSHVVIAAPYQPNSGSAAMGVLFAYNTLQPNWAAQPSIVLVPSGSVLSSFGRALALQGNRMAIGASNRALEYRFGAGTWRPFASVPPPSYGYSREFGEAVGLYTNGLLVGDTSYDDNVQAYPDGPGGVHTYDLSEHGEPFRGCSRGVALDWRGQLRFAVEWPQQAGKQYQVFGSVSGFGPTLVGGIQIPLTLDFYTYGLLANPQLLIGGSGMLNASGRASVTWEVPSGLPLSLHGAQFHHAVVAYDASSLSASNAVTSQLVRIY